MKRPRYPTLVFVLKSYSFQSAKTTASGKPNHEKIGRQPKFSEGLIFVINNEVVTKVRHPTQGHKPRTRLPGNYSARAAAACRAGILPAGEAGILLQACGPIRGHVAHANGGPHTGKRDPGRAGVLGAKSGNGPLSRGSFHAKRPPRGGGQMISKARCKRHPKPQPF